MIEKDQDSVVQQIRDCEVGLRRLKSNLSFVHKKTRELRKQLPPKDRSIDVSQEQTQIKAKLESAIYEVERLRKKINYTSLSQLNKEIERLEHDRITKSTSYAIEKSQLRFIESLKKQRPIIQEWIAANKIVNQLKRESEKKPKSSKIAKDSSSLVVAQLQQLNRETDELVAIIRQKESELSDHRNAVNLAQLDPEIAYLPKEYESRTERERDRLLHERKKSKISRTKNEIYNLTNRKQESQSQTPNPQVIEVMALKHDLENLRPMTKKGKIIVPLETLGKCASHNIPIPDSINSIHNSISECNKKIEQSHKDSKDLAALRAEQSRIYEERLSHLRLRLARLVQ